MNAYALCRGFFASVDFRKISLSVAFLAALFLFSGNLFALPQFFQNDLVKSGFDRPTSMAFLPDGRMLVAQQTGEIFILDPQQTSPSIAPYLVISDIDTEGERGLLDLVIDPDFPTKPFIYIVYHRSSDQRMHISRFAHDGDANIANLSSEFIVWKDPKLFFDINHQGGGLSFGPDGYLYLTTGEQFVQPDAQDLTKAGGKIIRVASDGTIPADNPFADGPGGNLDEIWAYGLRNPFRARWDIPISGTVGPRLFIGEVGGNISTSNEDVHIGKKGTNYGWPFCEGFDCSAPNPSYDPPIFSYEHNGGGAAIIGGIVYHGGQFPQPYDNAYFYGDWQLSTIRYLTFDSNGAFVSDNTFETAAGLVVDIKEGPDGDLYFVQIASNFAFPANSGAVRRISYNDGNQAPQITSATADVIAGNAPLAVQFSGAATDAENDSLEYLWIFGDGEQEAGANVTHVYSSNGSFQARLQVRETTLDGKTTTLDPPINITVGSNPNVTIQQPVDGSFFRAGDTINFSAIADDSDGVLNDNSYEWTILFVHNQHTHPESGDITGPSGNFHTPDSGHSLFDDTGFEISVKVTDSDGLSTTKSVRIYPEKVDVSFESQPTGISFFIDGVIITTPIVYDTAIDFKHILTAPQTSCINGTQYNFASWSNGQAASHEYTVPEQNETLTANYTAGGSCDPNASPLAFSDEATVPSNTSQLIGVLNNDLDSDGTLETGTVAIINEPQHGSVNVDPNTGEITYVHGGSATTSDSFTYTVDDNEGAVSNEATVSITITENICGNSVVFDGSNDWINIPDLQFAGDFTIEAWLKLAPIVDNKDVLFGQQGSGQDINFYAGQMRLFDGADQITANTPLTAGEWTHLALTRSGSTVTAYQNGVVDGTGTWSGVFTPKALGRGNISHVGMFEGEMDEIRLWNVARTATQISQNYTKKNIPSQGLFAYWNFDEGGQSVLDSSGSGNDGSLGLNSDLNNDDPTRQMSDVPVEGGCGIVLTEVDRPNPHPASVVVDEFHSGNTPGSWVVQQPSPQSFPFTITPEKITITGSEDNQNLTRLNTEIDTNRPYAMYSKFKIKTNGGIQSYAMHFLQDDQSASTLINSWTLNVDLDSGGLVKHMGFLNGSFQAIGQHAAPWAQPNKEYIFRVDVNRRKNGSFSPQWVTGKITTIFGTVLDHFEVDYSIFPWQPTANVSARIGLNAHKADWEAKDLIVWYTDGLPANSDSPLANAGNDLTATDNDGNGLETVTLDGSLSSDPNGDSLSFDWREDLVNIGSGQTINYDFAVGVHVVTLTVNDGNGHEATDNVVITINAEPGSGLNPPTAQDDTVGPVASSSITRIDVLANDSDDGNIVLGSVQVVTDPINGTADVDLSTGEIIYTHDGTATISDSFTYTVEDDEGNVSDFATVNLTIIQASASCGQSLAFDGNNEWINIPDLTFASDFTIEAWIKLAPGIDSLDALIGQEGSGPDINFYAGHARLFAGSDKVTANTAMQPDTWTHLAITRSDSNLSLYLNGLLDATGSWNEPLLIKALGRGNRSFLGHLEGELDEIRLWDLARSGSEIHAAYNQSVAIGSLGLVAYWTFNGSGQEVTDSSGSGMYGTLGVNSGEANDDPTRIASSIPINEGCGGIGLPLANAGNDLTATDNDGNGLETVTLDGSLSSDPNGDSLSFDWSEDLVNIGSGQTINYDFAVGVHTVTLTVNDGNGHEATDNVVITINAEPGSGLNPPTAQEDTVGPVVPSSITRIDVLANDSDDGNLVPGSVQVVTDPINGTADVDLSTGEIIYTHDGTVTTSDSFTYTVEDDQGNISTEATVSITIDDDSPPGDPVANDDQGQVQSGVTVMINVLGNDTDDGTLVPGSVAVVIDPINGTADVDLSTGEIIYTHDGTATVSDSFTYTVEDDGGNVSNIATVNLTMMPSGPSSCGQSLVFDGNNDWINIPNLTFASDFTIEAWIKLAPGIDSLDALIGQEGSGPDINFYAGHARLFAGSDKVAANTAMQPDTWTHLAITRSGSDLSLYLNGLLDATGVWDGVLPIKALGRGNRSIVGYLQGELDEVRLWDVARSGSEISLNYNQSVAVDSQGLVAYWTFNGSGQLVTDSSGSGVHGFLGVDINVANDDPSHMESTAALNENCVDQPTSPVVVDDSGSVQSGSSVTINVLANDSDDDGNLVQGSVQVEGEPINGTAVVDLSTGKIIYTHDGTATISDSFTYAVEDDDGNVSNIATVNLTITPSDPSSCGLSLVFDGNSDWVNTPDLTFANDFTIEAWIKLAPGIDSLDALIGQEGSGPDINFYDGKARLFAGSDKVTANTTMQPDTWTHLAITRSGSDLSLYLNGLLDATGVWNGILPIKALGRGNRSILGHLEGELDEVRLWSVARSGSQLSDNYNQSVAFDSQGLAAYWSFNGSGQQVLDSSGSGNSGSLGVNANVVDDDPSRTTSTAPLNENCGG